MASILIIEDEARIASFVVRGLTAAGFTCTAVPTAAEGFDHAQYGHFDLVVLDLGLPDEEGFALLDRIRGTGNTVPGIILTARGSAADTVAGLEGGADDYMTKPFGFDELLARIRLRLRTDVGTAEPTVLRHGRLSLDLHSRRASLDDVTVDLSAREFTLLETFLRNPEQVLSREQLLSRVWGYDFDPGSNVVDVYVRYLRQKLGASVITTIRGMGYRLGA